MSDAQNIDLKPEDSMAQAGIVLAEQVGMSLLSAAYKFPPTSSGHMQAVGSDGTLQIDGPVNGYVKTSMMVKKDDNTTQFGTWNHTEMLDPVGKQLAKVDQVNMAFLLDVLVTNKMGSHTDFRGQDGSIQFTFDGQTLLTPKDASPGTLGGLSGTALPAPGKSYTNDSIYKIKDAAGHYLGDVHLTAKPIGQGNVLDITASYSNNSNYVGDIETIITVDPKNHRNASFQIMQEYNPPALVVPPIITTSTH